MKPTFWQAMATYAVLAIVAGLTTTGVMRLVSWIFLGGLALKTWIAYKAGW